MKGLGRIEVLFSGCDFGVEALGRIEVLFFHDFWCVCDAVVSHSKTCKRPKASLDFMKREGEDSLSVRLCTSRLGGEALGRIEVWCLGC